MAIFITVISPAQAKRTFLLLNKLCSRLISQFPNRFNLREYVMKLLRLHLTFLSARAILYCIHQGTREVKPA